MMLYVNCYDVLNRNAPKSFVLPVSILCSLGSQCMKPSKLVSYFLLVNFTPSVLMSVNHHWQLDLVLDGKADGILYSSVKKEKQNIFAIMFCVSHSHNSTTYPCAASAWPCDEHQLKTASFDHCVDCFLFTKEWSIARYTGSAGAFVFSW